MALLVDAFYKQAYEERRLKDLKDRAEKLTARPSAIVPRSLLCCSFLETAGDGPYCCLAGDALAMCNLHSPTVTPLLMASDARDGLSLCADAQALLKCASGVEEEVFPPEALERGIASVLNSLANFSVDAPQAPKLVRLALACNHGQLGA